MHRFEYAAAQAWVLLAVLFTAATVVRFIVAMVLAFPLLWVAWAWLQPIEKIFSAPGVEDAVHGSSSALQWGNYREAVTRLPFIRFLLNACVITVLACGSTVFSSSLVGFAFARLRWRGRRAWFVVLLATMMLPAQVLLIPQFLVFEQLGWVNTYKPLIVPSWLGGSAFFIFLFRQFFKSVPRAYEDAARLDGVTD